MLRAGFYHTDHGSVLPHLQLLIGHMSRLTFSSEYRTAPGISNAILGAFRFTIASEAFARGLQDRSADTDVTVEHKYAPPPDAK